VAKLALSDWLPAVLLAARRLMRDAEDLSDRVAGGLDTAAIALKGAMNPIETIMAIRDGVATGKVAQETSVPTVPASSLCQEDPETGEMEDEEQCLERVGLDDILLDVLDEWDEPDPLQIAEGVLRDLAEDLDSVVNDPPLQMTTEEAAKLAGHIRARITTIEAAVVEFKNAPMKPRGDIENPEPVYPFIEDRNSDRARERYRTLVEAGLAGTIEWMGDPMDLCGVDETEDSSDVQARDKEIVSGDFVKLPEGKFKFVPPENVRRIFTSEGHESHVHLDYRHEQLPASWVAPYAFRDIREAWGKPKFARVLREVVRSSRLDDEQNLAELIVMLGNHMVRRAEERDLSLASAATAALKAKRPNVAWLEKVLADLDERLSRPDPDVERFIDAALPALGLNDWAECWKESVDWGEGAAADANDAGLGDVSDILWPDSDPPADLEFDIGEMDWGGVDLEPLLAKVQSWGPKARETAIYARAFIRAAVTGVNYKVAAEAGWQAWLAAHPQSKWAKTARVRPVVAMGASVAA